MTAHQAGDLAVWWADSTGAELAYGAHAERLIAHEASMRKASSGLGLLRRAG
jgi:hypothetical protein